MYNAPEFLFAFNEIKNNHLSFEVLYEIIKT